MLDELDDHACLAIPRSAQPSWNAGPGALPSPLWLLAVSVVARRGTAWTLLRRLLQDSKPAGPRLAAASPRRRFQQRRAERVAGAKFCDPRCPRRLWPPLLPAARCPLPVTGTRSRWRCRVAPASLGSDLVAAAVLFVALGSAALRLPGATSRPCAPS